MSFIGRNVIVSPGAYLGDNVTLLGSVTLEDGAIVEDGCMIGKPLAGEISQLRGTNGGRLVLPDWDSAAGTATVIGKGCRVGRLSTVYAGSILHEGVVCEEYSLVGSDSEIGARSRLMFRAQVHSRVRIGEDCRIGGFCCNDSVVGRHVSMFGHLLHAYRMPEGGRREPAPRLDDDVVVGFGAQIIGEVRVGRGSYIGAGSVITRDVPPESVATGVNNVCDLRRWRGRLRATPSS